MIDRRAPIELNRTVTLPFLILYGLGTMVGGGFFALMGKVAGEAGAAAPFAFLVSGVLALLSAFSFAELASRYPVSAGAARYVQAGFERPWLGSLTGWLVILTGVVSAATLTVAATGFLQEMFVVNEAIGIFVVVLLLCGIACWGINQSVFAVTIITIVEVGALLYVGATNLDAIDRLPERWPELLPRTSIGAWTGILTASFIAFYSFIGFEDLVNLAEEVKEVKRALPRAILASIVLTTLLYVFIAMIAVLTVPVSQLANSAVPIVEMSRGQPWLSTTGLWLVSVLTGINGALVQLIMGARVAYGLACRQQAPQWLQAVHPGTRTPVRATLLVAITTLIFALFLPLITLAKATSALILVIFAAVNLALWRIKGRDPDLRGDGPRYPRWLPMTGFVLSALMLLGNALIGHT